MRPLKVAGVLFVLLLGSAWGQPETRQVMQEVLNSFTSLVPYMSSESAFSSAKAEKEVKKHLQSLQSSFNKAEHIKALQTPSFTPSVKSIRQHLDHTLEAYEASNKSFALTRLRGTAALCMSCHTQLPESRRSSFRGALDKLSRTDFQNDFEYAEFLFMTRNFVKSLRYYERAISEHLTNDKFDKGRLYQEVRQGLKRGLTIFTKVRYNPDQALSFLDKFDESAKLPQMTKREVKSWMEQLSEWQKRKLTVQLNSAEEISHFIDEYLEPIRDKDGSVADGSHDVTLLIGSGILYKFLSHGPDSPLVPRALYWLAVADRQLDYNFFYSLADLYLKECIQKYPSSPFARKCYREYEDSVIYGYSGSGGTDIPQEEKEELERLKSLLPSKNGK